MGIFCDQRAENVMNLKEMMQRSGGEPRRI